MKVYLAARYNWKETMRGYARELQDMGIEITSRWLEEPHAANTQLGDMSDATLAEYAVADVEDVRRADMLIFFSETGSTPRGGRHVEFGCALILEKTILVVGPKENIFHYLPHVVQVEDWAHAKMALGLLEETQ